MCAAAVAPTLAANVYLARERHIINKETVKKLVEHRDGIGDSWTQLVTYTIIDAPSRGMVQLSTSMYWEQAPGQRKLYVEKMLAAEDLSGKFISIEQGNHHFLAALSPDVPDDMLGGIVLTKERTKQGAAVSNTTAHLATVTTLVQFALELACGTDETWNDDREKEFVKRANCCPHWIKVEWVH